MHYILDTETTGLHWQSGDKICEVAVIEMDKDLKLTGREFVQKVNPGREVGKYASQVNGLTWEGLKGYPKFEDIKETIAEFIGNGTIIAHNASFDIGFLNNEGMRFKKNTIICTKGVANRLGKKSARLDSLLDEYNIDRSMRDVHDALLDCKLLYQVFGRLYEEENNSI